MNFDNYNNAEIEEYEKLLYKAYNSNQWYLENYKLIDGRLIPFIDYKDQEIFLAKYNSEIIASMAVNFNNNIEFQCEKMGFKIEKNSLVCEGLSLFIFKKQKFFEIFFQFAKEMNNFMDRHQKKIMYCTANENLRKMYTNKILDFHIIDSCILHNKEKFLLKKKLY